MKKSEIEEYKGKLLRMKNQILNGGLIKSSEGLTISSEDLPDEADLANNVINQEISFNMRSREFKKLRSIEEALHRIEGGAFGKCEECDEEIKSKRLENQPWTTLCITHAEERERELNKFSRSA